MDRLVLITKKLLSVFWLYLFATVISYSLATASNADSSSAPTHTQQWQWQDVERIVVFADVHGAYDSLVKLLQDANVIDNKLHWIAGKTHLVSLGDLLDRGPDSRKAMDLILHLQVEAQAAGGKVHQLLGNHEMMNMIGDLRYVAPEEYAAFIDDESPKLRQKVRRRFMQTAKIEGRDFDQLRFDQQFPPGYFGHREAFSMQGKYTQWFLQSPFIIKINDSLFTHAGVSDVLAKLNAKSANELSQFDLTRHLQLADQLIAKGLFYPETDFWDRYDYTRQYINQAEKNISAADSETLQLAKEFLLRRNSNTSGDKGLLWYRGNAMCHPATESPIVDQTLASYGAKRIIIGHTPTRTRRIVSRIDGKVIAMDTGMLSTVYHGRASALIIEGDKLSVIYEGEKELATPEPESALIAGQPMPDKDLEDFLHTAKIIDSEKISSGVTKPLRLTLEKNGIKLRALYKNYDSNPELLPNSHMSRSQEKSDRYQYEIAAYKLDRLLQLNRVPVAVERVVKGHRGVVQYWINGAITETERKHRNIPVTGPCSLDEQFQLRVMFDILIYNDDRNMGNLLFSKSDWSLWFIDHSQAFNSIKTAPDFARPSMYKNTELVLSPWMRAQLESLNYDQLLEALKPYVHPAQVRALLVRRDIMLEE